MRPGSSNAAKAWHPAEAWHLRPNSWCPNSWCHMLCCLNTGKAQAFNDLHLCDVSNPDEYKWSTVHAVNSPPPRARHTATMVRLLSALHVISSSALWKESQSVLATDHSEGTCRPQHHLSCT